MCMQKFIKIFHTVQEIEPFSPFSKNLALGKASSDDKCHFAIPWARLFQQQIVCKILSKYSKRFKSKMFTFFQNLNLGKTSTIPKCHLTIPWATSCQYTKVCAKFHHNIQLSSRDRAIFTFSVFWARQNLDRWKMTFRNPLGYILIISMFTQKSIKIFHSVQEIRPFSLFQNLALGKASTDDKCHFAIASLFSEFEPRQKLNQSLVSFDNLMG